MPIGSLSDDVIGAIVVSVVIVVATVGCVMAWRINEADKLFREDIVSRSFTILLGGITALAVTAIAAAVVYGLYFVCKTFWTALRKGRHDDRSKRIID